MPIIIGDKAWRFERIHGIQKLGDQEHFAIIHPEGPDPSVTITSTVSASEQLELAAAAAILIQQSVDTERPINPASLLPFRHGYPEPPRSDLNDYRGRQRRAG